MINTVGGLIHGFVQAILDVIDIIPGVNLKAPSFQLARR